MTSIVEIIIRFVALPLTSCLLRIPIATTYRNIEVAINNSILLDAVDSRSVGNARLDPNIILTNLARPIVIGPVIVLCFNE